MTSTQAPPPRALILLVLSALLSACGPAGPDVSEAGRNRCREQVAAERNPLARHQAYRRCLVTIDAELRKKARRPPPQNSDASLAAAVQRCQERRPTITGLMDTLRRQERRLADIRAESYVPASPRPRFDEAAESRLRLEDQQLDRERYEAALAEWETREASGRRNWTAAHRQRLAEAQTLLNRTTAELRRMEPDLFTAPSSIEFVPAVAQRLRSCDPTELSQAGRAVSEAAGP